MSDIGQSVEQHIPRLRRYARALTGERAAADDLVQDTLERALSRFHLWRQGRIRLHHAALQGMGEAREYFAQSEC